MLQFKENSLIQIFIDVDDFCQAFDSWVSTQDQYKSFYNWNSVMSRSEVMSIIIFYQVSGYKCFQYYYDQMVVANLKTYYPNLVGYKRFLRLMSCCFDQLYLFAQWQSSQSQATGIYYADSKKLPVCDNRRIHSHKVFEGIAQRGKSSTGWYYGLKIHLVINNLGQIMSFLFTPANFADNNHKVLKELFSGLKGSCFADKGYISKLFEYFFKSGLKIVTKVRKNMKNALLPIQEKYQLMKRGIIESVNDILMTVFDIEHTRHRNPINALTHMTAALIAYNYMDKKPTVFFPELNKIKP